MSSNVENILKSIIDEETYTKLPQSRVEYLLLKLGEHINNNGGTIDSDMINNLIRNILKEVVSPKDEATDNTQFAYDNEIIETEVPDMDDLNSLKELIYKVSNAIADVSIDGTKAGYDKAMKHWFLQHNAEGMNPKELTALVDEWYALNRTGWTGAIVFKQPDISTSSTGEKTGDNAGLVCVPSTNTEANRDDYAGIPLFAVTTVNWILDENGEVLISAIKSITSNFEQDNPSKYVGVMQMTGYVDTFEDDTTYTIAYSDTLHDNFTPIPEAVKLDGTIRNFVCHTKYMSTTVDGKMTSCSGKIPSINNSHNSLITLSAKNGALYSAGSVVDWSFMILMTMIKYGSMTLDNIVQGCINYNYQYYAKVSEQSTNRVLITSAQSKNLIVGSSVIVGSYNGSLDRSYANLREQTPEGAKIVAIEDVTIDGTVYGAVYIDKTINVVSNGDATNGTTVLSTWHWVSGANDNVLGNDGSTVTPENGKCSGMIQGIEFAVGGYEVFEDAILNIENGYYTPYIGRTKSAHATSITAGMTASELKSMQPASDVWTYIRRLGYDKEIFFGTDTNDGNTSTYTRDGFYKNGIGTTAGTREWLAFGVLYNGTGHGGLSCLNGVISLGHASWTCLARLSCNSNRGEFRA